MANFKTIIPLIKAKEGGLSKNPNDNAAKRPVPDGTGYHTNKGITWGTFVDNAKKYGYQPTTNLFYRMPDNIWEAIYKGEYWDSVKADQINSAGVAFAMVDFAFNSGPGNAVTQMQQALNKNFGFKLKEDGAIGPITLNAINTTNPKKLLEAYKVERVNFIRNSQAIHYTLKEGLVSRINTIFDAAGRYVNVTSVAISAGTLFFCLLQQYFTLIGIA